MSIRSAACCWICITVAVAAPAVVADISRATTQPAAVAKQQPLDRFDRLIGTWRGDAHWSNGQALRSRVSYEYGVGNQLVKVNSWVIGADEQATHVFETFVYRHPRDNALRFISISNVGGVYDGTVNGSRDELTWQWSAFLGDRKTDYKQTIKLKSDEAYQWTVWQKAADGSWKQIIDAELQRQTPSAVTTNSE